MVYYTIIPDKEHGMSNFTVTPVLYELMKFHYTIDMIAQSVPEYQEVKERMTICYD